MSKLFRRPSTGVADQQQALGKSAKPDGQGKLSKSASMRFGRRSSSASIADAGEEIRGDDESEFRDKKR
jgi:hypothetical protein